MNDAVLVALITGVLAVIGEVIVSARNTKELYAKLDKNSEIADERIKGEIAVIHAEIKELRTNVEKHNSVIERVYNLEVETAKQGEQIKTLFKQ